MAGWWKFQREVVNLVLEIDGKDVFKEEMVFDEEVVFEMKVRYRPARWKIKAQSKPLPGQFKDELEIKKMIEILEGWLEGEEK